MTNPFETKWAKRPTPELVARLNDLISLILSEVDEDDEDTILGSYIARKNRSKSNPQQEIKAGPAMPQDKHACMTIVMTGVRDYASEAHWISEELEHRIRKTEYAGLLDIEITGNKKKRRRRRGPSGGGSGGGTLAYPES